MTRFVVLLVASATFLVPVVRAQDGPYKVIKTARVGGEGGWDYIYADSAARRLYIPRGAVKATPATDTSPETAELPPRLTVFDLDTLAPAGELSGVGGQGTAVDPKSGHGFTSDHPQVTMFDTKTLTKLKSIDVGDARPDGILFDAFSERVYIFSHPTKNATVIDTRDGTVAGTIDLGGTPEEGVADGKGMLYVVMQDPVGSVTAVDLKSMKAVAHYSLKDMGGCNGLALDAKNSVLFAACGRPSPTPGQPPAAGQPRRTAASRHGCVECKGWQDSRQAALGRQLRWRRLQPGDHGGLQHRGKWHIDRSQGKDPNDIRSGAGADHDERSSHHYARHEDRASVDDVARAHSCARRRPGSSEWPSAHGTTSAWLIHDPDDWKVESAQYTRLSADVASLACTDPRLRGRFDDTMLDREHQELRIRLKAIRIHDLILVECDGSRLYVQHGTSFLHRVALGEKLKHLDLPPVKLRLAIRVRVPGKLLL